jgi:hypothetical protein
LFDSGRGGITRFAVFRVFRQFRVECAAGVMNVNGRLIRFPVLIRNSLYQQARKMANELASKIL